MKKLYFILSLLIILSNSSFGSGEYQSVGARHMGLGNASVTFSDVFATNYNQAGLGFLETISIGASTELRFANAGIYNSNLSVAIPTKKFGTFAYACNFFGDKNYNEIRTGIAYGKAFGKKFSIGLRFDYMRAGIATLGSKNAFSFDFGVQYKVLQNLTLGAHIANPSRFKLDAQKYNERFATVMQIGARYTAFKKVSVCAEFEKDLEHKPNFKFGVEYNPISILYLRAGVNTQALQASFGVGIQTKGLNIDIASMYHPQLGFSPSISLSYNIKKLEKSKE